MARSPGMLFAQEQIQLIVRSGPNRDDADVEFIDLELRTGAGYMLGSWTIDVENHEDMAAFIGKTLEHELRRRFRATFEPTAQRKRDRDTKLGRMI